MMADLGAPIPLPEHPTSALSYLPFVMNAAGMGAAMIFRIPATGLLKKVCIRTSTVVAADDLLIRLETVDATTGLPTGTLYTANATGSQALVDTDDNKFFWVNINSTTGVNVTKGDIVALRINIDYVNGNLNVIYKAGNVVASDFPYVATYTPSTWTKYVTTPIISLEYDTGLVPVVGAYPCSISMTSAFSSSTNPNIQGNRIKLPFTARATGIWAVADYDGDCSIILYDTDGTTALETITVDSDIRSSTVGGVRFFQFATPRTLTKNLYYRMALKATSATSITLYGLDVSDDGAIAGLSVLPLGTNHHSTTCNGDPATEASWTNLATRQMQMGLMIDQIDIGGGGGPIVGSSIIRRLA